MGNNDSKIAGAATASAATTAAGIGLMFLGPIGMVAGGIVLSAGLSGTTNTVVQATSGNDFEFGKWGTNVGIGAAAGAVALPFAGFGGAVASTLTSTTAKVATHMAAQAAGGATANITSTGFHKLADKQRVSGSDIGLAALTGAITGVVTAGAGQAAAKGIVAVQKETVRAAVSKSQIAARAAVRGVISAAAGSGGSAVARVVENAIRGPELTWAMFWEFFNYRCHVPMEHVNQLWNFLLDNDVIKDETVLRAVPWDLEFPEEIEYLREATRKLIATIRNYLPNGVGEAAICGAVGGVQALVSSLGSSVQQAIKVKAALSRVSQGVKAGLPASSVEIEAYARAKNERVTVFEGERTADGIEVASVRSFGASSARTTKYILFVDGHYSTANSNGQIAQPLNSVRTAHNCFYEAVSGESAPLLRVAVAKFIDSRPARLRVPVKEIYCCELVGGDIYPEEVRKRLTAVKQDLALGKTGREFMNREGALKVADGQCTYEHDLPPDSSDQYPAGFGRGANRLVTLHDQQTNELVAAFTTEDHYKTFQEVDLETGMTTGNKFAVRG